MTDFTYDLKIPKERIAVLIGKDGEVKKQLETETKTMLKIDSEEGDVFVSGNDAILLFNAREVIKAIGRGFNPEIAMLLLKGDYLFELIELKDFIKTKNSMLRLKGRVIGQEGKTRRIIEEMTSCYIAIYGKTIGIVGDAERIGIAKEAVMSLLSGSPHSSVYKFLEKKKKELKYMKVTGETKNIEIKEKYKKELKDE